MLKRWLIVGLLSIVLGGLSNAIAAACGESQRWPTWESLRTRMIAPEGRVIDVSDPRKITTSEGQSYALFFALVNNDRKLFQRLLNWTEMHLAQGDLAERLPSWLWGQRSDGSWGVLDENSAADSDLWIAYTLLEAGRLWDVREYTLLGHLLLTRIGQEETAVLPGFGAMLLPGKHGFVHEDRFVLNPSYLPPQLVAIANQTQSKGVWSGVHSKVNDFLTETAPLGLSPDWIDWRDQSWWFQTDPPPSGSYDAIRVYLWVGMLADDMAHAESLKAHFRKAQPYLVNEQGDVAESVDILNGARRGHGPVGFAAALLPLLGDSNVGAKLRAQVAGSDADDLGYYGLMLRLFGEGWDQKRFAFDADGRLLPSWRRCE